MSSVPNSELRPFAIKNALVVDADPEINALLSSLLDPGSWAVQHAPDNLGALALARKKAFDLIVTSAKTSGREDIELLRRIRMTRPHTRLIIPCRREHARGRDHVDARTRLQLFLPAIFLGRAGGNDSNRNRRP